MLPSQRAKKEKLQAPGMTSNSVIEDSNIVPQEALESDITQITTYGKGNHETNTSSRNISLFTRQKSKEYIEMFKSQLLLTRNSSNSHLRKPQKPPLPKFESAGKIMSSKSSQKNISNQSIDLNQRGLFLTQKTCQQNQERIREPKEKVDKSGLSPSSTLSLAIDGNASTFFFSNKS